jgi:creatinine amidohydrolase
MAFLRPGEIVERLKRASVVYVPFGPLEWHGPHMPYGTDPLNAENAALGASAKTGGVVWPTQFWGTERERSPQQLASLGFRKDKYVVGMDFPKNLIRSMYCPEEMFALVVREILREIGVLGARLAVLVNGHGAENQIRTFERLTAEANNTTDLRVLFRIAAPRKALEGGSGEHAAAGETSLLMYLHPQCVDTGQLPPKRVRLKYTDYAVVDGPGFDGKAKAAGHIAAKDDPRISARPEIGRKSAQQTVRELAEEVRAELKALGRRRSRG